MGQLDLLIAKVNQYLTANTFNTIDTDIIDSNAIFRNSLEFIWSKEPNNKKRDFHAHQITNIISQYIGGRNTENLLKTYREELDNEYPPDMDFVEVYNLCLTAYDDVITKILTLDILDVEKIEFIIKKILNIVKKNKSAIVSHIALKRDKPYSTAVYHGLNTTLIALIGGDELKLQDKQLRELAIAGLLHDIGMLKIPQTILDKEEKLTEDEMNQIRTHPILSYKFVNDKNIFGKDVLDPIIQHHEQYDGNGYPRKLSGDKIHIYAKIISIADAFEAQISERSYRKSKTGYSAMKEVLSESQNRFDPKVLKAFLSILSIYPPGTLVQLNNNSIGTVTAVNPQAPLRPKIKLLLDELGEKPKSPVVIDLKSSLNVFISRVLDKEEYKK
ncbi:MAG TPA: HD-GYP domain-containing protein [Spirochaetota bacterium]|nr:HD-GYP domain-containing protein [Spirochaetota bacterium]HOS33630.1 HD-GYP domain-containing protein [Spirochaetota bacterium]HOS56721.1 HD-GYP domain-containing protein [Spirochaetota bacterium]HPK62777.1 HD-GYP domain-containing protein [Spirochaetota bacterium]HQF78825.1 HD-GYP domain-containing protein [Spirochaetota bacterium]